jgi:hypothetical protein
MSESPLPKELLSAFDSTIMLINELTLEAATLKDRFGDRSKLYQAKVTQIATLRTFYKETSEYIKKALALNKDLTIHCMGADLLLMQKMHGLSYRDAAAVLGFKFSEEHLKTHEEVDAIIKEVTKPVANE